jgi:CheY-like chemotaxis protein
MHTVLLVEDNKLVKLATQRLLTKAGYEVVIAEDGEEAVRLAGTVLPDIILLDMLLPKLNGPQVLAELKKNSTTAHISVLVWSGLSDKNAPKLLQAGASGFIGKEKTMNDPNTLLDRIKQILSSPSMAAISSHQAALGVAAQI